MKPGSHNRQFVAKTFHGLENVLSGELKKLGAQNIKPLQRAVSFEGDQALLYNANLHLRTALRILVPIHTFTAQDENALYTQAAKFDWLEHLSLNQTFAIDSTVSSQEFRHSKYVALKLKDAIVDQFRKKTGKRPSIDTNQPDIRFNVRVHKTDFTISLDSSGDSLHRRGYRSQGHKAPLNEVLAAGMLLLSGWDKNTSLIDPMCGSGTILLEAAMMACNMPPGINRNEFGFMQWKDYDPKLWNKIITEAKENIDKNHAAITGADVSQRALDMSKEALLNFELEREVELVKSSFERLRPKTDRGMLLMNPPYGERMKKEDIIGFYRKIGDTLKQHFTGFDAWILSANKDALKHVGLRPSKKLTLFNGPLECKFQKYEIFEGSRKRKG